MKRREPPKPNPIVTNLTLIRQRRQLIDHKPRKIMRAHRMGQAMRADFNRGTVAMARGARGRKRAIFRAFSMPNGCEHDWEYKEDWEGDPGVINGTRTISWLECCNCHREKPAGEHDRPDYDYDWD